MFVIKGPVVLEMSEIISIFVSEDINSITHIDKLAFAICSDRVGT